MLYSELASAQLKRLRRPKKMEIENLHTKRLAEQATWEAHWTIASINADNACKPLPVLEFVYFCLFACVLPTRGT